jgi:hypothetical protein
MGIWDIKLHSADVLLGEALAALLASQLVSSTGYGCFALEGDALPVIFAVNQLIFYSLGNLPLLYLILLLISLSFKAEIL